MLWFLTSSPLFPLWISSALATSLRGMATNLGNRVGFLLPLSLVVYSPSGSSIRRCVGGVGVPGSQVSGKAMATSVFAWHVRSTISLHVRVGMLSMVPFKTCEVSSSGRMSASATAPAAGGEDHRERLARTCV